MLTQYSSFILGSITKSAPDFPAFKKNTHTSIMYVKNVMLLLWIFFY